MIGLLNSKPVFMISLGSIQIFGTTKQGDTFKT